MPLRTRLPLTYGAIALLTALALGAVLLLILRGYYVQQERNYLRQNAGSVRELLAGLAEEDRNTFAGQVETLAFLTQTRIRVFSAEADLIFDSGTPNQTDMTLTMSVEIGADDQLQRFDQTIDSRRADERIASTVQLQSGGSSILISSSVSDNAGALIPGLLTPFNFGWAASNAERSSQRVARTIPSPLGRDYGTVELSEGPAFGREVMTSVTRVLFAASAIAVVLATIVGVFVSRRMTRPLVTLTEMAEQMASGDLEARSFIVRRDEIGRLAISFNSMACRIGQIVNTLRAFVADAAHEIHTPLTALQTNLELAAEQPDDPRHLQRAQAQTAQLAQLTGDLLQLSRLESAELPPNQRPTDFAALLARQSEPYASQAEQRRIAFQLETPDTPVMLMADAAQLQRVVDNLLDNALKFTPTGGEILVALRTAGESVEMIVRDSGIGIDGNLSKVFDRFYRAPNAAAHPGSGLGLAIVQHIVEVHGGDVDAQTGGDGTQFRVRLSRNLCSQRSRPYTI